MERDRKRYCSICKYFQSYEADEEMYVRLCLQLTVCEFYQNVQHNNKLAIRKYVLRLLLNISLFLACYYSCY